MRLKTPRIPFTSASHTSESTTAVGTINAPVAAATTAKVTAEPEADERSGDRDPEGRAGGLGVVAEPGDAAEHPEGDAVDLDALVARDHRVAELVGEDGGEQRCCEDESAEHRERAGAREETDRQVEGEQGDDDEERPVEPDRDPEDAQAGGGATVGPATPMGAEEQAFVHGVSLGHQLGRCKGRCSVRLPVAFSGENALKVEAVPAVRLGASHLRTVRRLKTRNKHGGAWLRFCGSRRVKRADVAGSSRKSRQTQIIAEDNLALAA